MDMVTSSHLFSMIILTYSSDRSFFHNTLTIPLCCPITFSSWYCGGISSYFLPRRENTTLHANKGISAGEYIISIDSIPSCLNERAGEKSLKIVLYLVVEIFHSGYIVRIIGKNHGGLNVY